MKVSKFLTLPRRARTIHLVINIPESPASPDTKPARRAQVWELLKVAGPITVSLAAITISLLNLRGQDSANRALQQAATAARQANAATATARQLQTAEHVYFLQNALPQPPYTYLLVQNLAASPVYNVTFQVQATADTRLDGATGQKGYMDALVGGDGYVTKKLTLWLGNIPACSTGIVDIATSVTSVMAKKARLAAVQLKSHPVAIVTQSMSFADNFGADWQYSGAQELHRLDSLPMATYTPRCICGYGI